MRTKIIITAIIALLILPAESFAQLDERKPGLYAVVGDTSTQLPYYAGFGIGYGLGLSVFIVSVGKYNLVYYYKNANSGVESSNKFALVIDPDGIVAIKTPWHFKSYVKTMTPNDFIITPLLANKKKNRREYFQETSFSFMFFTFDEERVRMDMEWEQITDNSFEIRIPNLLPGEYAFIPRMTKYSEFDFSAALCFTVPGVEEIFEIGDIFLDASTRMPTFSELQLSEEEKMAKPDYLFDVSAIDTLTSDIQRLNALGILLADMGVKYSFGMPTDEYKEAIDKLKLDDQFEFPIDDILSDSKEFVFSDMIRERYEFYKDNEELPAFWTIMSAMLTEITYIIANNPELYLSKITEEQRNALSTFLECRTRTLTIYSRYSTIMKGILDSTLQQGSEFGTIEYFVDHKEDVFNARNALLQ